VLPLPPDLLTRLQARYEDLCSEGFRPEELQGAFVFGLDRPVMLARGLDLSLVADRLGHATPNVTLGIYRHLLQEERKAGVLPLEDLLTGPRHQA